MGPVNKHLNKPEIALYAFLNFFFCFISYKTERKEMLDTLYNYFVAIFRPEDISGNQYHQTRREVMKARIFGRDNGEVSKWSIVWKNSRTENHNVNKHTVFRTPNTTICYTFWYLKVSKLVAEIFTQIQRKIKRKLSLERLALLILIAI